MIIYDVLGKFESLNEIIYNNNTIKKPQMFFEAIFRSDKRLIGGKKPKLLGFRKKSAGIELSYSNRVGIPLARLFNPRLIFLSKLPENSSSNINSASRVSLILYASSSL